MPSFSKNQRPRIKLLLLLTITLLAAFFRLYRIDNLPPGDGYDPAYYGVDALRILQGARPIMLPPNREVLFSYIVAVCFLVLGPSTQAIHISSSLVGILTVPVVYLVAEELFADEKGLLKRFGGLVAALMVAVSYWHLNWSRYGVRAILVPLFAATTFYFLWRGLRGGGHWAFVICGASLGLSMYTYQAARLLPLLVVVGFACVAWKRRAVSRRDRTNFFIVGGVALLVFAPLGYHFLTHPGSFTYRVEQAFVIEETQGTASSLHAVLDQSAKALLALNFAGDRTPYSTIPGRPSLNPFFSILFFLGIAISLARVRRPAYLLLLTWLGVMLIPAALAGKGPTAKRAIGSLPAVAILIAVGALAPWRTLRRWATERSDRWARWLQAMWTIVLAGGFVYSGVMTYRDYFVRWASNPNLFTHFELGISAIGDYIGQLPPGQQVYISPELPMHPAIRFHSGLREDIRGYNGRECLVVPGHVEVDTTYVIIPGKDGRSLDLLQQYVPEGRVVNEGAWHYGEPYFVAYWIPTGAEVKVSPDYPLAVNFGDRVQLLGYDLEGRTYQAGDTVHLTLYYQQLEEMAKRYTVFTHLLGPHNPATGGPLWGQDDSEPCRGFYPTTSWHEGEIVVDRFAVRIPIEAPSGSYDVGMGFYDVWTGERPAVVAGSVPAEHNVVLLGEVQVVDAE